MRRNDKKNDSISIRIDKTIKQELIKKAKPLRTGEYIRQLIDKDLKETRE